jgi:hypothetical protein
MILYEKDIGILNRECPVFSEKIYGIFQGILLTF